MSLVCAGGVVAGLVLATDFAHGLATPAVDAIASDFGGPLPADAAPLRHTRLGILGGTLVGEGVAAWFLCRVLKRGGPRQLWSALLVGHALLSVGLSAVFASMLSSDRLWPLTTLFAVIFIVIGKARPSETPVEPLDAGGERTFTLGFGMAQVHVGLSLFWLRAPGSVVQYSKRELDVHGWCGPVLGGRQSSPPSERSLKEVNPDHAETLLTLAMTPARTLLSCRS